MSKSGAGRPDLAVFPGGDLVERGLKDLSNDVVSDEALLVMIAGPRLRGLGFVFPNLSGVEEPYEHALYELLETRLSRGAHSAFNSLVRRVVSFAQTYSRGT